VHASNRRLSQANCRGYDGSRRKIGQSRSIARIYVGDTVTFASEVIEMRPSASRPQWGVVRMRTYGVNQKGERVYEIENAAFIEQRAA
jgi:acyl dehydratase